MYQVKDSVILIDLDPQSNCSPALGVEPNGADFMIRVCVRKWMKS